MPSARLTAPSFAPARRRRTNYERVKWDTYGALLAPTQLLVPIVADTFGGWGAGCVDTLSHIAKEYAKRRNMNRSGYLLAWTTLSGVLMRGVAALLLSVA